MVHEDTVHKKRGECATREPQRHILRQYGQGNLTLPAVLHEMIDSVECWSATSFCESVSTHKGEAEWERKQAADRSPIRIEGGKFWLNKACDH